MIRLCGFLLSLWVLSSAAEAETGPLQWSIPALSARSYTAGPLISRGVLGRGAGFTRFSLQFSSDGLTEYGFADVPDGPGPFPVIVMVHGHVSASAYHTLDYTTRYADALSRAGFLVLHPDLRGYGRSQGAEPLFYAGYSVDVLNLIGSVQQYAGQGVLTKARRGPVGLWGHSLGGNVVLRAAVVKPEWVSAVVMYGGMSGDVRENAAQEVNVYRDPAGSQVLRLPTSVTDTVSTPAYEARLKAAFSVHWGAADREVPPAWSSALCARLGKLGKSHDCFSYAGAPHLFPAGSRWNTTFLTRTTAFFQKFLGKAARQRSLMTKYAARYGVEAFVRQEVTRESPELRTLRQRTERMPRSYMLSSPDEVALLTFTARLIGAKRTLEVGTFTGYSALAMAQTLPQDGQVVALDLGGEYLDVAQAAWKGADVAHKIELRLGDAGQSLCQLLGEGQAGAFDLAFIDANQGPAYDEYYEACLKLLRVGGVVALENMLWSGSVADARPSDSTAQALRQLNVKLHADTRVDIALVTVGDGLMLARKR